MDNAVIFASTFCSTWVGLLEQMSCPISMLYNVTSDTKFPINPRCAVPPTHTPSVRCPGRSNPYCRIYYLPFTNNLTEARGFLV